jgi:AcrR family transcriptional regulator
MRTFRQKRAKDTHEALLRAAARVFAEHGFDGTQAPAIAKAAGVSTGAFYRYFEDKRHAFLEMIGHETERAHQRLLRELDASQFAAKGARAGIGTVLEVLFSLMRADTALLRVYFDMSFRDPEVAAIRASYDKRARETIAQIIAAMVPRSVVADPTAAALVLQIAAVEVVGERMGLRPRDAHLSDEAVLGALADMFYAYVGPRRTKARARTKK